MGAVAMNCTPRAGFPRFMHCTSLQMPGLQANDEVCGISTSALTSRLVTLPPWRTGKHPHTVALPEGARGLLYVVEGVIRYQRGANAEAQLSKGDSVKLQGGRGRTLVATAGERRLGDGAAFLCVLATDSKTASKW